MVLLMGGEDERAGPGKGNDDVDGGVVLSAEEFLSATTLSLSASIYQEILIIIFLTKGSKER